MKPLFHVPHALRHPLTRNPINVAGGTKSNTYKLSLLSNDGGTASMEMQLALCNFCFVVQRERNYKDAVPVMLHLT
jgi:hypothetical protein